MSPVKPPPLTQEDLKPNFKIFYYLFHIFMPIIPLRINVETGELRELRILHHMLLYFLGLLAFCVHGFWTFVTMWVALRGWEESKGGSFFLWENPIVILSVVVTPFYLLRMWLPFLFDLSMTVEWWNTGLEHLHLSAMISDDPTAKETVERLTQRLQFWGRYYCPIFAFILICHPWLYWRFNDHPLTLLARIDPEWKTTAVTLGCLGIDLMFDGFWMTALVFYLHCGTILALDKCIRDDLTEQDEHRAMSRLEAKMGKEAGKIKYPKTTGVYSY